MKSAQGLKSVPQGRVRTTEGPEMEEGTLGTERDHKTSLDSIAFGVGLDLTKVPPDWGGTASIHLRSPLVGAPEGCFSHVVGVSAPGWMRVPHSHLRTVLRGVTELREH